MNASQTHRGRRDRRVGRDRAEKLLDGAPASSAVPDDRLVRLLTAAAAPGRAGELTGEEAAAAAFTAHHLSPAAELAGTAPRRSRLGRIRSLRVLGLAAAFGGVGVALAAATGVFSGTAPSQLSTPATGPSITAPGPGASRPAVPSGTTPGARGASPGAPAPVPTGGTAPAGTTQLPGLCTEVAGQIAAPGAAAGGSALSVSRLEQALASPAVTGVLASRTFAPLTSAAGGAANVPDYCAILLGLPRLPEPGLVSSLPAATLASVPVTLLSQLSSPVLSQLPPPVLAKLPASVQAQLPPSVQAQLPPSVQAQLPPSVLATLPPSVLSGLPPSVQSSLPAPVKSELGLG